MEWLVLHTEPELLFLMSVSDSQCVQWLTNDQTLIRSAALELLGSSYSTNQHWIQGVFSSWDRFTPQDAFPEFPLLTHIEIPPESVEQSLHRAREMVEGKPLTDRGCRCAGKIVEAISVSSPRHFFNCLPKIRELKQLSKIFFRVDLGRMEHRAELMEHEPAIEPLEHWFKQENPPEQHYGVYPHLEAAFLRGQADGALKYGFNQLRTGPRKTFVLEACFELASRYRLLGYESYFADSIDDEDPSIADASVIALSRCRNDEVLTLIADRFPNYSKFGQLRSIDVLRRSRLLKTPELLRFLHPLAMNSSVQNALRMAEVLQFDFSSLEDWLEALMVMDDASLERIRPLLSLVGPLSEELPEEDRARALHLVRTRVPLET